MAKTQSTDTIKTITYSRHETFVIVDGREIPVEVRSVCMYRDVMIAKVRARHGNPFVENGQPTKLADFELSLIKVRKIEIPLPGYIQNEPNLNLA